LIIKVYAGQEIVADGVLNAIGTPTDSIIFTSIKDDSYGGDTNGDSTITTPAPGDWNKIRFYSPSCNSSVMKYCVVLYGGSAGDGAIRCDEYNGSANPTIQNCLVSKSSNYGIYIENSSPIIGNNLISNNTSAASGFPIYLEGTCSPNYYPSTNIFKNNKFQGVGVAGGNRGSFTWHDPGYPYVINGNFWINSGSTANLDPGIIIKLLPGIEFGTEGTLNANGTVTDSIIFTSFKDDSYGGDTNGDSLITTPALGDWAKVRFYNSGSNNSVMKYCVLKYGGSGNLGDVMCDWGNSAANPTIINNLIHKSSNYGIYLENSNASIRENTITQNPTGIYCTGSNPTIRQNSIMGNTSYGVQNVTTSIIVNAEYNWWGDSTGPYHPSTNPSGRGNKVSDYVDFDPWLGSRPSFPAIVSMPRIGVMPSANFGMAIKLSDVTGLDIISADITLTFNSIMVVAESVELGNVVPSGWQIEYNATPGQLVIAMAGTTPLSGKGPLVKVKFEMLSSDSPGDSTPIHFVEMKFNDYTVPASIEDGLVREAYQFEISGEVIYYSDTVTVGNTKLKLTGARIDSTFSNSVGYYKFANLPCTLNYNVTPQKFNTQRQTSVTSYDAALVLKHVAGIIILDSLQKIAADVSGNGIISSYDAALILRYTVGIIQHFPVGDWAFRPISSFYPRIQYDQIDQSYLAILYGDPSRNWRPASVDFVPSEIFASADNNFINYGGNLPKSEGIESDALTEVKDEKQVVKNTRSNIFPVTVKNCNDVVSADIILTYNPDVMTIENVAPSEHTRDYFIAWTNVKGIVRIGLAGTKELKGNLELARLYYQIKDDAVSEQEEIIKIHSIVLNEEQIITNALDEGVAGNQTELPRRFALMPNQPNPFKSQTAIRYSLPAETKVSLSIYDASGKLIKTMVNENAKPGLYSENWNGTDEQGKKVPKGVYFYRLEAGEFTATKKMVKME